MSEEFDPYTPLIGMTLDSFHIMRTCLSFRFSNPEKTHVKYDITLSTQADLCVNEDELFKPASPYDIIRPDSLSSLYEAIGKTVISFRPLKKKRVCRMEFVNMSIFTWADEKKLPDCLYDARQNPDGKDFKWWLIDDQ